MEAEDVLFSHPFPVAIVGRGGEIKKVNQKFELLLNRSEKFLKGKRVSELFSSQELQSQIERSFNQEIEILGFRLKNFFVHLSPFFVSSKKEGVFLIFEPAPENPFSADFLLFLKGLSHEIRNPLGGIKGAAKLFKELKVYDEELAGVIVSEVERIERLLNQITTGYDFSRPSFKCENLHRLIQNAVNLFSHRIEKEGVEVNYLFDPSLPEIPVDPDKLSQAFVNLVKNALEAMENSSKKELTVETGYAIRPAGFIFVKFKDSGEGMDEEELSRFGTPFFTTKERGTGIGTFVVKEVVKGHGGELRVRSEKGKGTEITILLPIKRRDGENPCG